MLAGHPVTRAPRLPPLAALVTVAVAFNSAAASGAPAGLAAGTRKARIQARSLPGVGTHRKATSWSPWLPSTSTSTASSSSSFSFSSPAPSALSSHPEAPFPRSARTAPISSRRRTQTARLSLLPDAPHADARSKTPRPLRWFREWRLAPRLRRPLPRVSSMVTDQDREELDKELNRNGCDLCVNMAAVRSHEDALRVRRKAIMYNRINAVVDNPWVGLISSVIICGGALFEAFEAVEEHGLNKSALGLGILAMGHFFHYFKELVKHFIELDEAFEASKMAGKTKIIEEQSEGNMQDQRPALAPQ